MKSSNSGKRNKIESSARVPPEPSCRRPLTGMATKKSPKTPKARYSLSPTRGHHNSYKENNSELSETYSDESDEESIEESDSIEEEETELSNPALPVNQESGKQRFSPIYRSKNLKLNANTVNQKDSYESTECLRSKNIEKLKKRSKGLRNDSTEGNWTNVSSEGYFWCFILLILGVAFVSYMNRSPENSHSIVEDRRSIESEHQKRIKDFQSNIRDIRNRFPGQNRRSWGEIESGIIDIINQSQKPWIFVLFSNETKELSCLAKMLGKASSKALHSEHSLELHPMDMGDDYGIEIDRLRPKINATKAVVVHDLLNINPRAIQAFHTMCDRENPLVEGAVYILTMITRGNVPELEKPVKFVEDQLTNRFINKVPDDKLQPLITRLTDGPIIPVKSEINLIGCPL